ncbi:MmpS family transport accessory protein [Mycolicibacterium lutetiense]|uniref:Secreted protein n=1 Tax=Mycolicibacterium lutetiense TaxID=1641992 RepID=A0ABS4ZU24_9MYCO|nr:MmpS family transport accessory protein [Mycolicibacterium lutetiense]MBP2453013.1 hypothetical protein [Mycolicibacterium lutetiense]
MLRTTVRAALAATLLTAPIAAAIPAHAAGDRVRYEIESNGPVSLVTYIDGIGDIQQDSPASATYWREFTNVATFPFYSVSAQTNGTSVACRLFVNGKLVDSNSSLGRYTIADCSYAP